MNRQGLASTRPSSHADGLALSADAADPDRGRARARRRPGDGRLRHLGAGDHPDGGADGPRHRGAGGALGPGIGGLLNVTFGNAPELIIALFALGQGLQEVVKASIVGSIIGNILLVLGAAMLAGGIGREKQTFSRTGASIQTSMLMLAAAALLMPAIFELVEGKGLPAPGRGVGRLRRHRRAPLAGGRDRPHRHLRGRPLLLAEDPPRPLQPRVRGRGQLGLVDRAPR